MDFALQTQLLKATTYFNMSTQHVYVRRMEAIKPFQDYAYQPKGGRCYYLSTWALMGLDAEARLVRGKIDLPERKYWRAQENYKHGWVVFLYDDQNYIYDSLESHVWPQSYWEQVYYPHDITFNETQASILELVLNDDNAYRISNDLWQMKSTNDMQLQLDSVENGFLRDTLGSAQIRYGYGQVSFFLAESRS